MEESQNIECEKIKESCIELGNPLPEYTVKKEDIMIMFKSLAENTNQADQDTNQANQGMIENNENSVPARIIKVLHDNPALSQKKIAELLGENISSIKYYMEQMKKNGTIKREGTSQKGKWIICSIRKLT